MATRHWDRPRTAAEAAVGMPGQQVPTAWGRVTALGALASFGLLAAFAALTSDSPAPTDTRHEFFDYVAARHDRLQWAAALYGLAMPAALLFLSGLFAALREAEGGRARLAVAAMAGGILAAAATLTGALVLGTIATRYPDLGPDGTRVWWTVWQLSFGAILSGQVLMIGSTAAIGRRGGLFSRWFIVTSVVLVLLSVVGVFALGFINVGIQVVGAVTVVLNAVWMLLVGVRLLRRPELAAD